VVPGGTHNQKALADARQLGRQHNIPLHGTVLELISIIDQLHTAAEVSHHTCPRRCKRSGSRLGESTDDKQQFCLQVSRAEGGGGMWWWRPDPGMSGEEITGEVGSTPFTNLRPYDETA